jgi:DNA primase
MPLSWERLAEVGPGDFTVRTVPKILASEGDAWSGIDGAVGNVSGAIALWDKDVHERGLGEMPFPPDFPKMPGEPRRVQPSRKRKDNNGIG